MSRHMLKLIVLLTVAAVAPASAGQLTATASHEGPCPHERARLAAAGYEALPVSTEGDPAEGSLFDPGRGSASFAP